MENILLDKAGVPLNKTSRLLTLKSHKDYTLSKFVTAKKVFTPNVNQALLRPKKDQNESLDNKQPQLGKRTLKLNDRNTRGGTKKPRETVIEECNSIFAFGVSGEKTKKFNGNILNNDTVVSYKESSQILPSKNQSQHSNNRQHSQSNDTYIDQLLKRSFKNIANELATEENESTFKAFETLSQDSKPLRFPISPVKKSKMVSHRGINTTHSGKRLKFDAKPQTFVDILLNENNLNNAKNDLTKMDTLLNTYNGLDVNDINFNGSSLEEKLTNNTNVAHDIQNGQLTNFYHFRFPRNVPFKLAHNNYNCKINSSENYTPEKKDFTLKYNVNLDDEEDIGILETNIEPNFNSNNKYKPIFQHLGKLKIMDNQRIYFVLDPPSNCSETLSQNNNSEEAKIGLKSKNCLPAKNKTSNTQNNSYIKENLNHNYTFELEPCGIPSFLQNIIGVHMKDEIPTTLHKNSTQNSESENNSLPIDQNLAKNHNHINNATDNSDELQNTFCHYGSVKNSFIFRPLLNEYLENG